MITSVTGVTRNAGVDLPTPARAPAPQPASEQPQAVSSPAREVQAGRTPQAAPTEGQGDRKGEREPEQHAPDPQASADTSRYLADLLTARVLGGGLDTARPSHITPERLSSLISYLEASLKPPVGAPREPASTAAGDTPEGVDVTS